MFDVWMGDVELTSLTLIISIVGIMPIQLLLCFKVKNRVIRLLPAILFSALTIFFVIMWAVTLGWNKLGYLFFAIFTGIMLASCGVGWGIWAFVRHLKRRE